MSSARDHYCPRKLLRHTLGQSESRGALDSGALLETKTVRSVGANVFRHDFRFRRKIAAGNASLRQSLLVKGDAEAKI